MAKAETITALHPDPEKQGTRVTKTTYEAYRAALFKVIPTSEEGVFYAALSQAVVPHLDADLVASTSPSWWVTTVKLDMEARGEVERVPGKGKQRVRLIAPAS